MHQKNVNFVTIGFSKVLGFKFKEHVCNKCHDLLTIAYSLNDIATLNAKGATFRCILIGISKNEGLKRLYNSVTYDRRVLYMDSSPNKTPIQIIKEGAFGGTYFRDVYSNINKKWYKNSWKEFVHLKNITLSFMHQIIII